MRGLKARALALLAVGLAWYAVGGPALVAKRAALAVVDRAVTKKRSEPRPRTG